MIDRFNLFVCCLLILVVQFILSPVSANAADLSGNSGLDPDSSVLKIEINYKPETPVVGEMVSIDLKVTNTSREQSASEVRVIDILPAGLRLKKGTVLLDGITSSDPVISGDNRALKFPLGSIPPLSSLAIHFEVEISGENKFLKVVNVASAFSSDAGKSNVAKVILNLTDKLSVLEPLPVTEPLQVDDKEEPLLPIIVPKEPSVVSESVAVVSESVAVASENVTVASEELEENIQLSETTDLLSASSSDEVAAGKKELPETVASVVSPLDEIRSLQGLTGKTEVPVKADVDGLYIKSMAENQVLENELAAVVSETDLSSSIRAGRSFSRESHAATARTEQAKAQTGQAAALLLPSVALRLSTGYENSQPSVAIDEATGKAVSSDTHPRTDTAITVRQPLFDLPTLRDWRRRKIIEQARGENYRVSDGDAYVSAVNAYLTLVSSRLLADMTLDFEGELKELLAYIEKRAQAGATSISDMARVRARSQATLSSRLELESAHAAAGDEFVRLTNTVPKKIKLPTLEDVGVSLLPASFDEAVSIAMKYNPEITALTAELEAAEIDASAVKGRYLPRVDAEYSFANSIHAGGETSSSGQKDQRIMAVLNWNIFSGGGDYKTHVERTARQKELKYRLDDQRRRVLQTLSANYATLTTTRERITSGYRELKSISTAAEAMSKRMLSGNQSLLDLLDVYDRFYQVRSRLVNLHILEMSSVAQLIRLTYGVPVTPAENRR
ncbi:MAG: TolC family protein [Desulfuromonadaceae bacterium]|nr:TolC family protein [Desulfuromonadaceae bacterium]MDD2854820.1 TolC family protein [Desulfuromonadaceae bacterium]